MKKIFLLTIVSVLFLFIGVKSLFAQSQQLLVVTGFTNDSQMDLLFSQSIRVLTYTEGGEGIEPKVLSLISPSQKAVLVSSGLSPIIIDESPDISRYVLLVNPKPDQASFLQSYGEVFAISPYYTLLKIPAGGEFVHEGVAAKFFRVPFVAEVKRPPKNIVVTPRVLTPTPPEAVGIKPNYVIIIGIVMVVVLVMISIATFLWIRRRRMNNQQPQF